MIQAFEAVRDDKGEIIDFRWILNNHASEKAYGDVIGKSLVTLNPGVVEAGIFDTFKKVEETGEPDISERHYQHEQFDGWFYQSAVKLGDGIVSTTVEITERKKAEQDLQNNKDLLQATIDSSLDVIQVFEAVRNEKGKIVDVVWIMNNRKAIDQNGDVMGKSLIKQNPGVITTGIFDTMVAVAETGMPHEREQQYNFEQFDGWYYQAIVKAGDLVVMTTRDITEQKRDQQEILQLKDEVAKKATDKYYSIFNSIDEGFEIFDLVYNDAGEPVDFFYIETNPAFKRQTGLVNVEGKFGREVSPNIEAYWLEAFDKVVKTGEPVRIEN